MDKGALLEAVGVILRERFAEMQKQIDASRIVHIEHVRGSAVIAFANGTTQVIHLPSGPQGDRGERGLPGSRGEPGERGEAGEPGEAGARGGDGVGIESVEQSELEPDSFTLRMSNGELVDIELPRGERGEKGDNGEPGRDRFIVAPRQVRDGELVAKNDLIAWGGGIMQAIRATTRTPDDDAASYVCIVAGVASLAMVENLETRTYDITARLSDGTQQVLRARAMPRFMADGPRPGESIIKGDQFVKGDWLYTATADASDPANVEAGGWRRQNIRGKRGEDGARGEAGPGIADVELDEAGILTIRLTTGEEKVLDARALVKVAA